MGHQNRKVELRNSVVRMTERGVAGIYVARLWWVVDVYIPAKGFKKGSPTIETGAN